MTCTRHRGSCACLGLARLTLCRAVLTIQMRVQLYTCYQARGACTLERVSTGDEASTPPRVHADSDASTLTTAEAAAILGRSEGTVRRLIRTGQLPAVAIEGERTTEYRLRAEDVHDAHGRVNAYATRRIRVRERVTHVDASPLNAPLDTLPVRMDATAGMQAFIDQAIVSATAPLATELAEARRTIERLATENGTLRERLAHAESARDASAAPQDSRAAPTPTARPVATLRVRVLRWLRA